MSLQIKSEIKISSDPCVLALDGEKIFVGAEDGTIKSYELDLTPKAAWKAHEVQLFALAAANGQVYSASNDGGIRVWSTDGERIAELPQTGSDIQVIRIYIDKVFAGDEAGNIVVYENNIQKAKFNVLEEVKGLAYNPPMLFTVRDLDLTVTEIHPDDSSSRFTTRQSFEGRAPVCVHGNKLVLMARGGNNLILRDATAETNFKKLDEIKISDMIVTSLAMCADEVWSGGWDGHLRLWKIVDNRLQGAGVIDLGACINSIETAHAGCVYVALTGGRLVQVISIK